MIIEAVESILSEQCTTTTVRSVENGGSPHAMTSAIAESGFFELLVSEETGGGGLGWHEFFDVVTLCGARSVPIPLAQTMAARAIVANPLDLPDGLITFAPYLARDMDGSLQALHVPNARTASHVLAALGEEVILLPILDAHQMSTGIHGSLSASLRWQANVGSRIESRLCGQETHFHAIGALIHAGLLAGAMKRSFELTMNYANERIQFGKPIGKFQAIQHQLSVMAEHVLAGRIAAEAAFAVPGPLPTIAACAVAKVRSSEAAQLVAAIAHAVHGAIGMTEEYELQLSTRRLHDWRVAHGSERHWNRFLGKLIVATQLPLAADFARSLFEGEPA